MLDNFRKVLYATYRDYCLWLARRCYRKAKRSCHNTDKWIRKAYGHLDKYKHLSTVLPDIECEGAY